MSNEGTLIYQIALTLIPGIGDMQGKKLVAYCGGAEAVFGEKKKNLLKIPGIGEVMANAVHKKDIFSRAEKEAEFIRKYHIYSFYFITCFI